MRLRLVFSGVFLQLLFVSASLQLISHTSVNLSLPVIFQRERRSAVGYQWFRAHRLGRKWNSGIEMCIKRYEEKLLCTTEHTLLSYFYSFYSLIFLAHYLKLSCRLLFLIIPH